MLILLDGADGAGKSTLAQRIVEFLNDQRPGETVEVWHRGKPTRHPIDEYVTPLFNYHPGAKRHIIADRWHWGELVYPKVKSRATKYDESTHAYTELFLRSRGALGVHVWRDHVEIQDVFRQRGEFVLTSDELLTTQRLFTAVENGSTLSKMIVRPDENDVISYIVAEASRAELKARTVADLRTYVGPPQADTLILGDVRNDPDTHIYGPAFVPFPATSGAFLMRALCAVDFLNADHPVGIANACDVDEVVDIITAVQPLRVVTLGNNAYHKYYDIMGPDDMGAVPHPQYVRRFHNAFHREYGQTIAAAAYYGEDMRSWRP